MDFIFFIGRFHVLLLHLSIGIIVALFVLEWLSRKE
jgi:cytochrome bd-type quinol oxidase subunit 1